MKLKEFRNLLIEKYSLSNPGMASENLGNIHLPGILGKKTEARLEMSLNELVEQKVILSHDVIEVTDKVIPTLLKVSIHIE